MDGFEAGMIWTVLRSLDFPAPAVLRISIHASQDSTSIRPPRLPYIDVDAWRTSSSTAAISMLPSPSTITAPYTSISAISMLPWILSNISSSTSSSISSRTRSLSTTSTSRNKTMGRSICLVSDGRIEEGPRARMEPLQPRPTSDQDQDGFHRIPFLSPHSASHNLI